MGIEIKWTTEDPTTGERRIISAEKFARQWFFKWKQHRRDDWTTGLEPTRAMWEHILDSLKRRYQRREGVSEEDIADLEKILRNLPIPRDLDEE
ncbi:MAG: hypothetical protein U0840_25285 [Gemmataceae bacterium]